MSERAESLGALTSAEPHNGLFLRKRAATQVGAVSVYLGEPRRDDIRGLAQVDR